jgi:NAD(P)-dependent dehydrogenase (short-subunit alcohol dehydrogenase family)
MDFSQKVCVVTGASSGIGAAAARALYEHGATVIGWDLTLPDEADLQNFAKILQLDVRDPQAISDGMAKTVAFFDSIDYLVCCAGVVRRGDSLTATVDDWDLVNDVNLRGVFLCARATVPHMRDGCSIVSVGSMNGISGGLFANASYQASKGGLVNLTRALALEWAPRKIRVNSVAPTFTQTPFIHGLSEDAIQGIIHMTPLRRLASPIEVAHAIMFLLSDEASMITGHTLPVDGGFLAQ